MWFVETEAQRKAREDARTETFRRMAEEAARKAEARKIWEAGKCPHCGRNDPLPPWLI